MNNSQKPNPVTMSVSQSETSPLRTSKEDMSALMIKLTPPKRPSPSTLRLSFLTIPTKSLRDILQLSIAILLMLPANLKHYSKNLIDVLTRSWKRTQSSLRTMSPLSLKWCPLKDSSVNPLRITHHSEDSLSEI